jgi:hypothetical protein
MLVVAKHEWLGALSPRDLVGGSAIIVI